MGWPESTRRGTAGARPGAISPFGEDQGCDRYHARGHRQRIRRAPRLFGSCPYPNLARMKRWRGSWPAASATPTCMLRRLAVEPAPPFVPGHEGAGAMAAPGNGVTSLEPGDAVGIAWLRGAGYRQALDAAWHGRPLIHINLPLRGSGQNAILADTPVIHEWSTP